MHLEKRAIYLAVAAVMSLFSSISKLSASGNFNLGGPCKDGAICALIYIPPFSVDFGYLVYNNPASLVYPSYSGGLISMVAPCTQAFDANGNFVAVDTSYEESISYTTSHGQGPFTAANLSILFTQLGTPGGYADCSGSVYGKFLSYAQNGIGGEQTWTGSTTVLGVQFNFTGNGVLAAGNNSTYPGVLNVPPEAITTRLISLYTENGTIVEPTPNLLTGISQTESSYASPFATRGASGQFSLESLYGQAAYWPTESPGGISTGLMQIDVSMTDAWDWQENTMDGYTLLNGQKHNFAATVEHRIRNANPGLPALSAYQMENMMVGEYGPGAFGLNVAKSVYIASCTTTGSATTCSWALNSAGNAKAINYINVVRGNLQQ